MSTRTTLFLAVLTMALLVYVQFFSGKTPGTLESENNRRHLLVLNPAGVNRIEITTPDGAFLFTRTNARRWQMETPVKYPANEQAVGSLLSELEYRERLGTLDRRKIGDRDKALELFGLAQPRMQISLRLDNDAYTLELGRETVRKGVFYGRIAHNKNEEFVLLEQGLEPFLQKTVDQWRSPQVFDFQTPEVASINLRQDSREVDLQKDGSNWQILKPLVTRGDGDEVNTFMAQLLGLRAEKFVTDNAADFANYGINAPFLILTVKTKNSSDANSLRVGRVESGGNVTFYGQMSDRTAVFQMDKTVVDQISGLLEKIRDRRIVRFRSIDEIASVSLEKDKFSIALQRKPGSPNAWEIVDAEKLPADDQILNDLLLKLQNARASDFMPAPATSPADAGHVLARIVIGIKPAAAKAETKSYELVFTQGKKAQIYVQSQFRNDLVSIPADVLVGLPEQKTGWIDRKIALFDEQAQLTALSWKTAAGVVQIARKPGQPWPTAVDGRPINGKLLEKQLLTLMGLRAVSWFAAADKDFASPTLTLTVEAGAHKQVLDFVADSKNNRCIGRVAGAPYAFTVDLGQFQLLNLLPGTVFSPNGAK